MKEFFKNSENNQCIHTRNILTLIDLDARDNLYNFLINHEKKCTQCSSRLKKFKEDNFAAKIYISKPFMPKDMSETFNQEVSELFKVAGLNEAINKKNKIKHTLQFLDKTGETLINNLSSKMMMQAYAVALLCFLGLRFLR